jgi:uncharacterized protein (DUF2147 family)
MIRSLLATLLVLLITPALAAPAPITGRWVTQGGQAVVEVAPCGQALCGRIVRILKPGPGGQASDANNPDKSLRARPIQGLTILSSFTANDDHWRGRIYDPQSGRTYRSELRSAGGTLKVKGCFGPFCRTQTWTRAG